MVDLLGYSPKISCEECSDDAYSEIVKIPYLKFHKYYVLKDLATR